MSDKAQLRRAMKAQNPALSPGERAAWSRALARRVPQLMDVKRASHIMLFWGMVTEPDTVPLMEALHRLGKALYLPRVAGAQMDMVGYAPGDQVRPGPYGILEPTAAPSARVPDLVLAPGLAFDRFGGRLGHGAGYYDRFLRATGARALGLCFERQLVDRVPMDALDVPMALVITQRATYREGEELRNC